MTATSKRPCPICTSNEIDFLHEMNFKLPASSPLPTYYRIVCCKVCGMVYADSESCQSDYDTYYECFSKYEDTKISSGGGYSIIDRERLQDTANTIMKHHNIDASIVDIGCANGGLLDELHNLGCNKLTGIDPSLASIDYIKNKGYTGYASNITNLTELDIGLYNGVILSHVLEHIYDLKSTLEIIKSLLCFNGFVYIEVPNASSYFKHYVVPYYYFDSEHINHFDITALDNLANIHGFEVIECAEKLINVNGYINYPAIYIILKYTGLNNQNNLKLSSSLKLSVLEFIKQSAKDEIQKKILYYYDSKEPIILWGAGSYTQRLMTTTQLSNCNIVAIVDNDRKKQGLYIDSILIRKPEVLKDVVGVILIISALHSNDIKNDILNLGLKHKIDVLI